MKRLRRGTRDDRGATMVEFALVVPLVILLLVGCVDFARVLNASVTIENASREGTRYATLNPRATGESADGYLARIHGYVARRVVPLDADLITVGLTSSASSDPRCAASAATSCTWAGSQPAPTRVTVTVSYPWSATAWLIGPVLFRATSASALVASASMDAIQ